ncbi:MAG: hypothetical protein ACKVP5_18015 [Aestuariivirga sp.]
MPSIGEDRLGESFEEIEAAVQETRRGRWFLEELVRRTKSSDTTDIMQAIRKLEMALTVSASNLNASETAFQILSARREIAGIRNNKLAGGGEWADDSSVFDKLAVQARECAGALGARIEDLQDIVAKSRESGAESTLPNVVESLQNLQANHDLLARRVARLSNLMSQLALGSHAPAQYVLPDATLPGAPPAAPAKEPVKLEAHHLPFFRQDEEIFEAPKDPLPPLPAPPPAPLAVVERKPAPTAIERADEPKGARLIIRRVSASEAAEASQTGELESPPTPVAVAPAPPSLPEFEPATPPPKPANERPRIVIVKSSETPDIPLPGGEASETAA